MEELSRLRAHERLVVIVPLKICGDAVSPVRLLPFI
jgi:hypothetical protein